MSLAGRNKIIIKRLQITKYIIAFVGAAIMVNAMFFNGIIMVDTENIWSQYNGGFEHIGYSKYNITVENITELWNRTYSYTVSGVVIDAKGTLYTYMGDYLYVLDYAGNILWTYSFYNSPVGCPALNPTGNIIYCSDNYGHLIAINTTNGQEIWNIDLSTGSALTPTVGPDGTIYLCTGADEIVAVNPNGTLMWKISLPVVFNHFVTPTVDPLRGRIYIGCEDYNLTAVDLNGTVIWKYRTGGKIYGAPAVDRNGVVYFGSDDGYMYSLYPNGTLKWKYSTGSAIRCSPAIGPDGTIYFGCWDGYLYALKPNGTLWWRYYAGTSVDSSPVITNNSYLIFTDGDYNLRILDENGTLVYQYHLGEPTYTASSVSVDNSGRIYVHTTYCLFVIGLEGVNELNINQQVIISLFVISVVFIVCANIQGKKKHFT